MVEYVHNRWMCKQFKKWRSIRWIQLIWSTQPILIDWSDATFKALDDRDMTLIIRRNLLESCRVRNKLSFKIIANLAKLKFGGKCYDYLDLGRNRRMNWWSLYTNTNFNPSFKITADKTRKYVLEKVLKLWVIFLMPPKSLKPDFWIKKLQSFH